MVFANEYWIKLRQMPEKYTKNVAMLLIWEKWYAPGKSTKLFLEKSISFCKKNIFEDQTFFRKQKTSYSLKQQKRIFFLTFFDVFAKGGKIKQQSHNWVETHTKSSLLQSN